MSAAVLADGLRVEYGATTALAGIDVEVGSGSTLAVLGHNGAGKTTLMRVLTTLVRPDGGRAAIDGFDVVRQAHEVRRRIGVTGQYAGLDEFLTGRENIQLMGSLYGLSRTQIRSASDELLERFSLTDAGDKVVKEYSGGMRRRLDLAASLILAPPVLFLDEPTAGLDPRGRNEVWDAVRGLVAGGTTVLLTTQYLDEADQLASTIAVMDAGKVIAAGTPEALKAKLGGDRIDVVVHDASAIGEAATVLAHIAGAPADVDLDRRLVSAPVRDRLGALTESLRGLEDAGVAVEDLNLRRPTLDEVFLTLTGGGR